MGPHSRLFEVLKFCGENWGPTGPVNATLTYFELTFELVFGPFFSNFLTLIDKVPGIKTAEANPDHAFSICFILPKRRERLSLQKFFADT